MKAGEIIGTFSGSLDYNVVDTEVNLPGFVTPQHYQSEDWKIHTKDPFDYFKPTIRGKLISKSLRTAKPEGGKIDYDIDGKLVGNWFEEGTYGYAGLNQNRYWAGHLSIVYDSIDPEHILVSIGTYQGRAEQFGVKGNVPDPANVEVRTGLVKYELVHYNFYDGQNYWDMKTLRKGLKIKNDNYVAGVALYRLIDKRRLKAEFFPGKQASQVTGFTNTALIYER